MSKLHELLAVDSDLRGQAEACRTELKGTFEKKGHHFTKKVVTVKSLVDGLPDRTESQLNLQTTVHKELDWIGAKMAEAIDVGYQIDVANTLAKADVILDDGTVLLKDVPNTALLRLEHRITDVKDLVHAIPTLDPAKGFAPDATEGDGIYRARDDERALTEKKFSFVVMVPATDRHPAQVKEPMDDVKVATKVTQEWSSLLTVADKGDMLDRVEDVLRAVRQARSRANDMQFDVKQNRIGDTVLQYMFSGKGGKP